MLGKVSIRSLACLYWITGLLLLPLLMAEVPLVLDNFETFFSKWSSSMAWVLLLSNFYVYLFKSKTSLTGTFSAFFDFLEFF
jgi:hypothetical protein